MRESYDRFATRSVSPHWFGPRTSPCRAETRAEGWSLSVIWTPTPLVYTGTTQTAPGPACAPYPWEQHTAQEWWLWAHRLAAMTSSLGSHKSHKSNVPAEGKAQQVLQRLGPARDFVGDKHPPLQTFGSNTDNNNTFFCPVRSRGQLSRFAATYRTA